MSPDSSRQRVILVAEDDEDDQLLILDALEANNIHSKYAHFVEDGEQLTTYLSKARVLPSLILLDLNMPKKDGREALKEIKSDERLKHIPVIIFTTSNAEEDVLLAYLQGTNTYITKPSLFSELVETIAIIKNYWFHRALLADEIN